MWVLKRRAEPGRHAPECPFTLPLLQATQLEGPLSSRLLVCPNTGSTIVSRSAWFSFHVLIEQDIQLVVG